MYILENNLNVLLWGFQASGKTTLAAALQDVGKSRTGFAKHGGMSISLSSKQNNFTLDRIVNDIKRGETNQRPTERSITYHYDCRFKSSGSVNFQNLCRITLLDRRGGDFDQMQNDIFKPDKSFVESLLAKEKTVNGILLLFSLDQFTAAPLQAGASKYLTRDKVFNFLVALHEVIRDRGDIPIAIAVNHIADGNKPRNEVNEAREAIQGWVNRIFVEHAPVVYFIDSVAAILGEHAYREKISLPLLDLVSQFLMMAKTEECGWFRRFSMGDTGELRSECRKFILETINSVGG